MLHPLISCICLTADRPKYLADAIHYFQQQTWPNKELVILDNGSQPAWVPQVYKVTDGRLYDPQIRYFQCPPKTMSIGRLRNCALSHTRGKLIAHWDDDDVSTPERLAEQFELLSTSNCHIVGYRTMYFRDDTSGNYFLYCGDSDDEIGTSFFYPRELWENRQFRDLNQGEDYYFADGRHVVNARGHDPVRMIARHHGGCTPYPGKLEAPDWRRVSPSVTESLDDLLFKRLSPLVSSAL